MYLKNDPPTEEGGEEPYQGCELTWLALKGLRQATLGPFVVKTLPEQSAGALVLRWPRGHEASPQASSPGARGALCLNAENSAKHFLQGLLPFFPQGPCSFPTNSGSQDNLERKVERRPSSQLPGSRGEELFS